ncbi:DUF4153 domain-containing protein [Nocardia ignorata]|uniref:Uncharacterized protein DUF4173 n=1 Tax=Nocardia ignorata TaxID=145285 RepID=A0A4R6PRS9_NOCIG|nr:DUF4153 domain-containing protein [Nocardia ignorata]TDP41162.1 uncharacterized protein DUF4173 [Nocardia ignorata]
MTKSTTERSGEDNELPAATPNPADAAGADADRGDSSAPATPEGRIEPSPEVGPLALAGPDTGRSEATPDAAPPGAKEQSGFGATHHGADSGDSTANPVVPAIIAQAAATTALLSQKGNQPSDTAQSGDSDTATADSGADTTTRARKPVQSDSTPAPDRAAPNESPGSVVEPTTSPAGRSASGSSTPPSWTSGWQAAAVEPMSPIRHTAAPPRPPAPPRWRRVARPSGVLPAAALVGVIGATVIPTDRPGIGWLLTGTAITATLCAVDQRARKNTTRTSERIPAAPEGDSVDRDEKPVVAADTTTAPSVTGTRVAHDSPTEQTKAITPSMPATATPGARSDTAASAAAESDADPNTTASAAAGGSSIVGVVQRVAVRWGRGWWVGVALVLLGVGAVRAAGWLFAWCVVGACVAGSFAVLGRRSTRGVWFDMIAVPVESFVAVPWAFSGVRQAGTSELSRVRRYGASVAATAALLVVFVPLLGGADATFATLLSGLVPQVDSAAAWEWLFMFAVLGMGALGALYLLAGPLPAAGDAGRPSRLWTRSEWALPVAVLAVLFGVFLGGQFVALFGGDDYVQRTAGLTYAEYARSGFWQLSAVSILALAVIAAVLHFSAKHTAADRLWVRVLLGVVSLLTLIIVVSALGRMWTYQQAYGFTVLRLLVSMCELWVGLLYVLMLVAIARLRWSWVPRAAVGTALATLVALAAINPEHLVAERNIARWEQNGRLDADYLTSLSPDILPALEGLPDPLRAQIEPSIRRGLDDDPWWAWNLSRSSAR